MINAGGLRQFNQIRRETAILDITDDARYQVAPIIIRLIGSGDSPSHHTANLTNRIPRVDRFHRTFIVFELDISIGRFLDLVSIDLKRRQNADGHKHDYQNT